jgi:hypothetical protein
VKVDLTSMTQPRPPYDSQRTVAGHHDEDGDRAAGEVLSYAIASSRIEQSCRHPSLPDPRLRERWMYEDGEPERNRHALKWLVTELCWHSSAAHSVGPDTPVIVTFEPLPRHRAEHANASTVEKDHAKIATVDVDPGARRRGLRR